MPTDTPPTEQINDRVEEARRRRSQMRDTFGRDLPPLPERPGKRR